MNELVFRNNDQVVTSSRNIARDFGKEHYNVLRDIEGVLKNEGAGNLFYKTFYIHEQNKQKYPMYLMNRDGFTLLAMGFTGTKAMSFKMKYINQFNEMEKQIKQPSNRKLLLETALEHEKKIEAIETDVSYLKNSMRIDGVQEHQINKLGKQAVLIALGGYKSSAYKEMSGKVFARFWRDFKNHFSLPRYGELPRSKFEEAIEFIDYWHPDTSTRLEIESVNRQQVMSDVI